MNTNIYQTRQALDVAYNRIIELERELNVKLNDELSELINDDNDRLLISIDYTPRVNHDDDEGKNELKITLGHNPYRNNVQRLKINCDFAKLEIITTTTDALKIKKLIEFCEKNILG